MRTTIKTDMEKSYGLNSEDVTPVLLNTGETVYVGKISLNSNKLIRMYKKMGVVLWKNGINARNIRRYFYTLKIYANMGAKVGRFIPIRGASLANIARNARRLQNQQMTL